MPENYYDNVRHDLIPYLPNARGLRVLDVGCGEGLTGAFLKREKIASRVVGIELFPEAGEVAKGHLDRVLVGDLESLELPAEEFDLILCADVIEHLRDPWALLERVVESLVPGGWLLTSTPNIRYWRILYDLTFHGKFEYTDSGILDRTHLRWFTRRSLKDLHEELGLQIVNLDYPELSGKRRMLDRLTGGLARDLLSGQHVVLSQKPPLGMNANERR